MTKLKDLKGDASIEGGYFLLEGVVLWRNDGYFPAASMQLTCHFKRMCTDSARARGELDGEQHHSLWGIPRVPLHGPFHVKIAVRRCDYTDSSDWSWLEMWEAMELDLYVMMSAIPVSGRC
jgi:hypothetical protein